MSGPRYIALIARDGGARSAWTRAVAAKSAAGFATHLVGDRFAIVVEHGAACAIGREGVVIGALYARGRAMPVDTIDDDTARSIVATRGDWLIRTHWGAYVAFLAPSTGDAVSVLRAPLGDLSCYMRHTAFGTIITSDVDLLIDFAGFVPIIDWKGVARHLAASDLPRRMTCLEGLEELAGGERLIDRRGDQIVDTPWRIWDHARADRRETDPREAARRVRDVVQTVVAARVHGHRNLVLQLSGGLDSSIVAACLATAGARFTALTLVAHDGGGDERAHARRVAAHLGVHLVEADRDIRHVDLTSSDAQGLPRPVARGFTQASAHHGRDAVDAYDASAILDGGGGDNMFASLQSVAAVADCLRGDGGAGQFWQTARSIGLAAHTSTTGVARRALVRSWTRGPAYRWPVDYTLLSAHARSLARGAADHGWLEPPAGALASSAAHIALLAAADSVPRGRDVRARPVALSPLIAQPVAEACLRIPGWLWTRDGHNRVVARDAFRALLPAAIIDRRDKGTPDGFVVALMEAQAGLVRSMLTQGHLAAAGMLDMPALDHALAPASLLKGYGYVRLMQLVDAEAWIGSWNGYRPRDAR